MAEDGIPAPTLAGLCDEQRQQAMGRLAALRPHLDEGVPLARAARHAGIPVRTAERWLSRYRRDGIAGLARSTRSDAGKPRLPPELVALVEGMGLKRPRSSAAAIQRRALEVAKARGWPAPSYGTVHAILARLDPAMVTLAHEGAAALRFQVIYSAVGRPQGRGKIERLFGTLNTELLPELPGHLVAGKPATAPSLSLAELDRAVSTFVTSTYHARAHSETGTMPLDAWRGQGFLPRLPDSLEALDLLLLLHAKPRVVLRDGIHFQGLLYVSPTLTAYVGDPVTIRYDPRDLSEIRVLHRDRFLCRAVSEEHAGETVTLKDIETARRAHRRALRAGINERIARVADYLPARADPAPRADQPGHVASRARSKLRLYEEDGP